MNLSGMFLPVSTGLESARDPCPSSTATVDSDAARVTEFNRGIPSRRVQEAHQESTTLLLRWEKLLSDHTIAHIEGRVGRTFVCPSAEEEL